MNDSGLRERLLPPSDESERPLDEVAAETMASDEEAACGVGGSKGRDDREEPGRFSDDGLVSAPGEEGR